MRRVGLARLDRAAGEDAADAGDSVAEVTVLVCLWRGQLSVHEDMTATTVSSTLGAVGPPVGLLADIGENRPWGSVASVLIRRSITGLESLGPVELRRTIR